MFINIFSLLFKKISVKPPIVNLNKDDFTTNSSKTEPQTDSQFKNDNETKPNLNIPNCDQKDENDFFAHNATDFNENYIEDNVLSENTIYPQGYYFKNPSVCLKEPKPVKNRYAVCNDANMSHWKNAPYVARPWFQKCEVGLCYNFNEKSK